MSDIETLRDEMRSLAIAAGQSSIEEWDSVAAAADARFAEYCTRWADRLDALLAHLSPPDLRGLVMDVVKNKEAEVESCVLSCDEASADYFSGAFNAVSNLRVRLEAALAAQRLKG